VLARTLVGEMGVLPGHTPVLGILAEGEVRITPVDGAVVSAEVDGGFLSVDGNRVLVVAEHATVEERSR
jgi:F-type H+-transporting ATPase subunit epsilon